MDNQQGNLLNTMGDYFEFMAYSIGAMIGDGTVNKHIVSCHETGLATTRNVCIANMDLECITRVCEEVDLLLSKDYRPVQYINPNGTVMYRGVFSSIIAYDFFSYFVREKLHVPDEAFRASRKAKLDFIAGLFDTDGYVSESNGYFRVGFASRHSTFVEDLSRLLQKLGVKVGKIYTQVSQYNTTMYIIKPNIKSFIDSGCYFHIKRKAEKLVKYLTTVKHNLVLPSETIMPNP